MAVEEETAVPDDPPTVDPQLAQVVHSSETLMHLKPLLHGFHVDEAELQAKAERQPGAMRLKMRADRLDMEKRQVRMLYREKVFRKIERYKVKYLKLLLRRVRVQRRHEADLARQQHDGKADALADPFPHVSRGSGHERPLHERGPYDTYRDEHVIQKLLGKQTATAKYYYRSTIEGERDEQFASFVDTRHQPRMGRRRPMPPFLRFANDSLEKITALADRYGVAYDPELLSVRKHVISLCSSLWKLMSDEEKGGYVDQTLRDKEAYVRERRQFEREEAKRQKRVIRRPSSKFILFLSEFSKNRAEYKPGMKRLPYDAADHWWAMSDEEKRKYELMWLDQRAKYLERVISQQKSSLRGLASSMGIYADEDEGYDDGDDDDDDDDYMTDGEEYEGDEDPVYDVGDSRHTDT